jgi:hypothetical protein
MDTVSSYNCARRSVERDASAWPATPPERRAAKAVDQSLSGGLLVR